jgi:hypothetical protein
VKPRHQNPLPKYTVDLLAAVKRVLCSADDSALRKLGDAVIEFETEMPLTEAGEISTESTVRTFLQQGEGME